MAADVLSHNLARVSLQDNQHNEGPQPPRELLFRHTGYLNAASSLQKTPRLLFRVYDRLSNGATDEHEAASTAVCRNFIDYADQDIFAWSDSAKAAKSILDHLKYGLSTAERLDNLVSWTASLLFALKYIFFRNAEYSEDLQDIFLCIVETSQFPPRSFIQDMCLMDHFRQHNDKLANFYTFRHRTEYYFAEYLSQGVLSLQNRCTTVSGQDLVNNGLLRLLPQMGEIETPPRLARDVQDFRRVYEGPTSNAGTLATTRTLGRVLRLVQAMPNDIRLLMGIWLLALSKRRDDDPAILEWAGGSMLEDSLDTCSPVLLKLDHLTNVPEAQQCYKIAVSVWQYCQMQQVLKPLDSALCSLRDMTLGLSNDLDTTYDHSSALGVKRKQLDERILQLAELLEQLPGCN